MKMFINIPSYLNFIIAAFLFMSFQLRAGAALDTAILDVEIDARSSDYWQVKWTLNRAVKKLYFYRSFDNMRQQSWISEDGLFFIDYDEKNARELIRSTSGSPFVEVSFKVPRRYRKLNNEYAPFFPFKTGGTGFFTGRYLLCIENCSSSLKTYFSLEGIASHQIITYNSVSLGSKRWLNENETGEFIYIGPPIDDSRYVIDDALSGELQHKVKDYITAMVPFFESKFGVISKPQIFLSWSPSGSYHFGSQGGVIGSQLYYHWYGIDPEQRYDSEPDFLFSTMWFLAHEIGHLYQLDNFDSSLPIVHEGMAEYMALDFLSEVNGTSKYLHYKLSEAKRHCEEKKDNLGGAPYACGLLFFNETAAMNKTYPYQIWQAFSKIDCTDTYDKFLKAVTSVLSSEQFNSLSVKYPWIIARKPIYNK